METRRAGMRHDFSQRVTRSGGPQPTGANDGDSPAARGRLGSRSGRTRWLNPPATILV